VIPDELRALPQWVGWRVETRKGKPTKVPINPHTGARASSTDPTTWGSYRQALATLTEGVGFVFSPEDPYTGLDMDGCVSANGAIHPVAYRIVRALNGYVEFSPSGYGLHIIVRGSIPRGRHTLKTEWKNELAVYSAGRFFTMSGDGRGTIREAQAELTALVSYYFPEPDETRPERPRKPLCDHDREVVGKLLAEPRLALLWHGDTSQHQGDHSAADLALCAHLAFYCGSDHGRIDGLFRMSGLMRDKWDEPRGDSTYGRQTIEKALGGR
jgi:putative DNA primase/helicase